MAKAEHMQTCDQLFHWQKYILHKNVCTCLVTDKYENAPNSPQMKTYLSYIRVNSNENELLLHGDTRIRLRHKIKQKTHTIWFHLHEVQEQENYGFQSQHNDHLWEDWKGVITGRESLREAWGANNNVLVLDLAGGLGDVFILQ